MKRLLPAPRVVYLVATLASGGCQSFEDGAKETFSKAHSCPEARITVTPRPDVDAFVATFGKPAEPAPEIKADPERLAIWTKEQNEHRAAFNDSQEVFAVAGCDLEELYRCFHPQAADSSGTYASAACSPVSRPASP